MPSWGNNDEGDNEIAVIIDTGSGRVKAGFSNDDEPRSVFPSLVAHPTTTFGPNSKMVVGERADRKYGVLEVKPTIERGIVTNWDDLEHLWHHTFYRSLHTSPEFHPVFLTEVPLNPKANRERIAQLMFETFKVPALYMNTTAALSLYAHGRTTGCILELGEGVSHVVPVYEGVVLVNAIARLKNMSGRVLTNHLEKMLCDLGYTLQDYEERNVTEEGLDLTTRSVHLQVRSIMEDLCYVALDFNQETLLGVENSHTMERSFTLPNGDKVVLGNERFFLPEALFQPELADLEEGESVVDATFGAIMKCDEYMHGEMLANIVLSGGCTKFPGFQERLAKELKALAPKTLEVNVLVNPEPQNTAWIGAKVVASLDEFQNMWISNVEYNNKGPSIIHSKCF